MAVEPIVSCEWLKERLDKKELGNLRILQVAYGDKEKYVKSHIPNALFFDLGYKADNTEYLRRNLPKPEFVEEAAQLDGVNSDTHVIIYDASGTNGFYCGARGWWTFYVNGHTKVSVLNGGFEKWVQLGFPVTSEIISVQKGNFKAKLRTELLKTYDDLVENVDSKKYQLIDSRPGDQFIGSSDDPKSGHYPGAKSVPHPDYLDKETGLLKDLDTIKQMLADRDINLDQPVIGSCNTATSASTTALIVKMLGKPDIPLYLGSFQEWKRRAKDEHIVRD